ncbi:MAG: hypothetical protein HKN08_09825 [Gammaproteobacteria bacterium]|nr:hypothetical protein [Gammaproteobacteria bacterium]
MNEISHTAQSRSTEWRALTYYNVYRFFIALLFVVIYWVGQLPEPLGIFDEEIFILASHAYLVITVLATALTRLRKPSYNYQVSITVLLDIFFISAFIYSSNGLNSGFGMLMVIAIAGGSILIPGRIGFFFAAIATLCVLGHEVYLQLSPDRQPPNYIHAGFLGITYFLTAFISHALASRVEKSEALAKQRQVDLENLARLNENIVQRLQSGIIVLSENHIKIINESARNLLGVEDSAISNEIDQVSNELAELVHSWQRESGAATYILSPKHGQGDVQVSLLKLNVEDKNDILIFLDDVSKLRQQAQQLKLASLGRLTASIAHEVRNPVGAISHAAQLLGESQDLKNEEQRLVTIINQQSLRVNSIIENVMRISRRERPLPVTISLNDWLKEFSDELKSKYALSEEDIKLGFAKINLVANMDPEQLNQVMWNICENALRYSTKTPRLLINCDKYPDSQRPYIDIIDFGGGIDNKIAEQLFEPFMTTELDGTGLGLFIARELCESNQATLNLTENTENGCTFRIIFTHPDKRQTIN